MLQFEELRLKLQGMEPELRELKQSLNIDKLGIEIAELERKAAEPSFWDDMENSQKVLQRTAQLKASVETYNKLQSLYEDTLTLIELAEEAGDESVYEEAAADTEQPGQKVLDSTTSALVTALNVANNSDTLRRQFSVTFKYVVDDAAPITVSKDQSYFYGTVGTFTVPEGVIGSVYKWSVTAGGKKKDVLNYGTTYTLRMQNENAAADSILVTAYLTTDTAPAENQVQLSVQDQYRSNVYQGTLLQDANVTVSQLKQVQVGDSAVALTGSAYYKLAGWQVMEGDKPHNINYGTYTLAELAKIAGGNQVILRPVYVYNGQDVFTVSLDGEQLYAKGYDVRVSVSKAADAYALAVKTGSTYAIATYGSAYDFYIDGSNKEFFTVNYLPAETDERGDVIRAAGYYVTDGGQLVRLDTDKIIRYNLEHKFPTAFSVGLKSASAATTFSTYSAATTGLPEDVKITEMGTLYTRDAAMATDAAFTVDSVQAGKNVKMVKAKSPTTALS